MRYPSAKVWPHKTMATDPESPDPNRSRDPVAEAELARLAATMVGLRAAVRQRQGEAATVRGGADELHGLLLELQRHEFVQEPFPVSPRPLYGPLLVLVRKAFYHLFMKWHARAVLSQQNSFNQSASRLVSELALRQKRAAEESAHIEQRLRRLEQALDQTLEPAAGPAAESDADPAGNPAAARERGSAAG